jgi:hypothetical protein
MHPTRIMGLGFSREWLRAGDDERYAAHAKATDGKKDVAKI